MSFVNLFNGKRGSRMETRGDVQSPLIASVVGEESFIGSTSRPNKASRYFSGQDSKTSQPNRQSTSSKSMRMSVTDLLEQAEHQTEMFSKLFPLIDKDKYRTQSTSSDSDVEMTSCDQRHRKDSKGRNVNKNVKKDDQHSTSITQAVTTNMEGGATCGDILEDGMADEEPSLIITNSLQPPKALERSTRRSSSVTVGVHIEYLIWENKLKVSVHRFEEDTTPGKDRKRRIAKLFLMPGNLQCQKVNMILGTGTPQSQNCAYFSGIDGTDLVKMEIGVEIFVKQGIFKKDKLIMEWSIPLSQLDLMEYQTAWKIC